MLIPTGTLFAMGEVAKAGMHSTKLIAKVKISDTSQLKYIALIAMTIDHIAAYMFEIPIVLMYKQELRMLGRISAPIFLFVLIQSVRFTSSRVHLLIRLYIAGIIFHHKNN